ncbi:tetratricopeptide repeat protein [Megalodesulfovibrio paquesii]
MAESSRTPSPAPSSSPRSDAPRPGATLISFEEAGIPSEHPALLWIQSHLKQLALGIAVVVLAAAAWSGLSWHKTRTQAQAADALGALLTKAHGDTAAAELEAFIKTAPSPVREGAMLSLAELLMASEEYTKAAEVWGRIAMDAKQPMKLTAGMGQAQALALAGKAQEALTLVHTLEKGASASFGTPLLRLKAQVAEAAGEYQDAIAAWASLMEKNPDQESAFFRQKMAQLEQLKSGKQSS